MRLQALRPAPAPGFRGELRRKLLGARRRGGRRTQRSVRALAYAAAGALLLAIAALGLAGAGPFAPG